MDLGGFLRETRIELGISIEEVEEETKIRKYYIEALEDNNFAVLPPQVYACGFVKKYARVLGLDSEEVVSVFSELAYGKNGADEPDFVAANNDMVYKDINKIENRGRRFFSTRSIIFALVFLVAVIWLGNNLLNYMIANWRDKENIDAPTPPQQPITEYVDEQQYPEEPPVSEAETPEATVEGVSVEVEITAQCWLTVVVDGQQVLAQILKAGEQRNFQGQRSVYLKAGNAGGITVRHKEEIYAPLGAPGAVIDRTFTAD
ncbi:MAG: DUF4115 domain-containing protein [Syntrophomonadaceae bacterium]|jgi:cytoskeletal protein RodZ|nr:DUF4115 domain-containing protein [Syntrophomonadaceae bacterium]